MTYFEDYVSAQSGPPTMMNEIKLIDVPSMEYYAKDNKGEVPNYIYTQILMRGNCITAGYFKNPQLTKEVFDSDGWVHTVRIMP